MVIGVEAVQSCDEADRSALPVDVDSGMLDSYFVSLNLDQNLFGFSWKLTREEKKSSLVKGGKEILTASLNYFFNVSS